MAFWKSSNPGIVLVKIIFGLPILILQSIWIYVFGCCGVYAQRCVNGLCCGLCVCGGCTFRDRRFPPKAQSLGAWKGKSLDQVAQETEWLRIKDICKKAGHAGAKLFSGEIESADICQGQLGDCWLMSAFSSLAECPGAIQKVFVTREYNHYGKYVVKLYDAPNKRWIRIAVSDWFPCKRGSKRPIFAQPNGDEAWVLLLEKAMAKMCGSYAALDGGNMVWALQAMTGDEVFKFLYEPKTGSWVRHDLVHLPERGVRKIGLKRTGECLSHDRMFHVMRQYVKNASVIGASTGGGKDTENTNGIVHGHAYSVMDAQHVEGFRMVRLRNPWGTFEWQGAWSDHHPNWEKYPKVKRKLDFSRTSDGTFWMEWKDFIQHYRSLDFCARTTGWDDLVLDIHEESRCCGPMIGCAEGCFKFWCCCYGLRVLFCSRRTKAKTAKPAGQGACCCCCQS